MFGLRQQSGKSPSPRRRATILIFTVAALTLLALIGVGLLASVRSQRSRVQLVRAAATPTALLDGVVENVRERLRADIWGDNPNSPTFLNRQLVPPAQATSDGHETNEPFDAPGPYDRWLASTVPYLPRDTSAAGPIAFPTGNIAQPSETTLAWHRVSYLGSDIPANGPPLTTRTFRWRFNSRTGVDHVPDLPGTPVVVYADRPTVPLPPGESSSLQDVLVRTVPPDFSLPIPGLTGGSINAAVQSSPLGRGIITAPIAGSTTNVTIAEARRIWAAVPALRGGPPTNRTAADFPYFDTNMDGEVDLYDADGDGVPDSPISFVLPWSSNRRDQPREVYAVIRIVDNSSMVNVNTATAVDTDGNGSWNDSDLMFHSPSSPTGDRQFRGRWPTEICLDGPWVAPGANLAPVLDGDRGVRIQQLTGYRMDRNVSTSATFDSNQYVSDVLRRWLVGGLVPGIFSTRYGVFDRADELALRGRNVLGGYVGGGSGSPALLMGGVQALPNTIASPVGGRWTRFALNETTGPLGWIALLETETMVNRRNVFGTFGPFSTDIPALRRPLLTTSSRVSDRSHAPTTQPFAGLLLESIGQPIVVQSLTLAPFGASPEKIDINQPVDEFNSAERATYLGWLLWAMLSVSEGSPSQGLPIPSDPVEAASTGHPVRVAAQLAANLLDYRDSDWEPTVIFSTSTAGPLAPLTTQPVIGLESQPFFSEVYALCVIDESGSTALSRFAVELINPYPRPMVGYRLKIGSDPASPILNLDPIPPSSGGVPGRLTVLSHDWTGMFSPAPPPPARQENELVLSEIAETTAGRMRPRRLYLLRPDVTINGNPFPLACDAFIMDSAARPEAVRGNWIEAVQPAAGEPNDVQRNFFQRAELVNPAAPASLNWKFTVARSVARHGIGEHTIGEPNDVAINDNEVLASVWTFRDFGLAPPGAPPPRAFESPLDLARLLAIGHDGIDASTSSMPNKALTVPEKLAYFMHSARMHAGMLPAGVGPADVMRAAGRLDFADLLTPVGRPRVSELFNRLTCSGGQFDFWCDSFNATCYPIDNDGNGIANDPGEFARVAFRQAGLINVNTAPAAVLRAVPWMTRIGPGSPPDPVTSWDFAPAIVSLRENRPLVSAFGNDLGDMANLTGSDRAGRPFTSVADLLHVSGAAAVNGLGFQDVRFDVQRFLMLGGASPDNMGAPTASPDFDRAADGTAAAANDIRTRDVYVSRWANLLTTRSDVFTVYITLIDENGRYLRRTRLLMDRSRTAIEDLIGRGPVLPTVEGRADDDYYNDMK